MSSHRWNCLLAVLLFPVLNGCDTPYRAETPSSVESPPAEEVAVVAPDSAADATNDADPSSEHGTPLTSEDDIPVDDGHGEEAKPLTREDIARIKLGRGTGSGTPSDPLQLTFENLKWDVEAAAHVELDDVPQAIRDLDNKYVSIRGYMYPSFRQSGLTQFIMLQNDKCKFGTPDAFVYHNIRVTLREGNTTELTSFPVTVEGLFKLDPMEGARSATISLFTIGDAEVSR